ncbi:hypothetical protein QEN19_002833 [Hanseniaspora menglaensis]
MIPKKKNHTKNNFVALVKSWFLAVQEEGELLIFDKEMSSSGSDDNKYNKKKRPLWKMLSIFAISLTLVIYLTSFVYSSIMNGDSSLRSEKSKYVPRTKGLYFHEIKQHSPLIFPAVEQQPALKTVGLKVLFTKGTQGNYVVNVDQKPMTEKQLKVLKASEDTNDKTLFIKNQFLDHGRLVYDGSKRESPKTVIVTLVDFDTYGLDSTVKIVQNRVDYAQQQGYGLYVRWVQEFVPFLQDQDLNKPINHDFAKFIMMRQAMHSFPHAENFWFIDKSGLIMDIKVNLETYFFDLTNKEMIENNLVFLNSPVIQDGSINTHSNIWKKNAKLSDTTDNSVFKLQDAKFSMVFAKQFLPIENLDTSSFLMRNDLYSQAFLDYFGDPLYRQYGWQSIQQALSHIFEWHPHMMRSLLLIREKVLGSYYHPELSLKTYKDEINELEVGKNDAYRPGDFIIKFRDCLRLKTCNSLLTEYYNEISK